MDFYQYLSSVNLYRKTLRLNVDDDEVYEAMAQVSSDNKNPFGYRHAELERGWIKAEKPYYNVFPAIVPMIDNLDLDIPCSAITVPEHVINIRLPKPPHNPFKAGSAMIRSIIFGKQPVAKAIGSAELVDGICLGIDVGEVIQDNHKIKMLEPDEAIQVGCFPVYTFKNFPLMLDKSIEDVAESLPYHSSWLEGVQTPKELIVRAIKLVCCVCLIGDDPEIVTPDVLAKDRLNFSNADENKRKAIVDRAKRRGKNGFNLGADIDKIPHYRKPHLAIVWTGKGRTKAKIVMRKGSVVHREIITKIPTGYSDE